MAEKVSTKQMKPVGSSLSMTLDNTTFVLTIQLKDQSGNNLGEAKTVDLTDIVKGSVLSDLSDVQISSAEGGQVIMYDAVLGKWKNATSTVTVAFDGISGSPYDNTALAQALNAKTGCILRRW